MKTRRLDPSTEIIVALFAAIARPIIRSVYGPDSCIASTRIALNVFHHFGLRANPLVARMEILNGVLRDFIAAGQTGDPLDMVRRAREAGAKAIGIGFSEGPVAAGQWAGHLVAVVEKRLLVDASADQASRPEHGIELPGVLVADVTTKFVAGLSPLRGLMGTAEVTYFPNPSERSYTSAPDWKNSDYSRKVTDAIVAEIRRALATKEVA